MTNQRIGNDIRVKWALVMKGTSDPFILSGKNVSLYLRGVTGKKKIEDFSVAGNAITWTFFGKDQKHTGVYSLILVVNEGVEGMVTTDACNFVNLVSCSCKTGGSDDCGVFTETIELTSTLEYVAGGGSYDDTAIWEAVNDKVDKVEGKGLSTNDYTDAEKEKLAELENYDDSGIRKELEGKADEDAIPTKLSELEMDIEVGSDYDDTAIRQEITELSEEVGKKQNTITDLENIRSGAAKGATALQSVPEGYATKEYVNEAIKDIPQGGGGSTTDLTAVAYWGVTTQTLKIVGTATTGYKVEVSEPQYGWIPKSFVDMVTILGKKLKSDKQTLDDSTNVVFNKESGYFEYRGLANIAYDEMMAAYTFYQRFVMIPTSGNYKKASWLSADLTGKLRFLLTAPIVGEMGLQQMSAALRSCHFLELGFYNEDYLPIWIESDGLRYVFSGCYSLRDTGYFQAYNKNFYCAQGEFSQCVSLENVWIKGLAQRCVIAQSPLLTKECMLYIIRNSAATSAMTITLHPNAYARLAEDADIVAALEEKEFVSLASA